MSSISRLEESLQNLQIFIEHNEPSATCCPSIYGLTFDEGRLISHQTCLPTRIIDLICSIVADWLRNLLCCWTRTAHTSPEAERNLVRSQLALDVAKLNLYQPSSEQEERFLRVQDAFNRIMESIRSSQTSTCMNGLYHQTGWDLGEELSSLSIIRPAVPLVPISEQGLPQESEVQQHANAQAQAPSPQTEEEIALIIQRLGIQPMEENNTYQANLVNSLRVLTELSQTLAESAHRHAERLRES